MDSSAGLFLLLFLLLLFFPAPIHWPESFKSDLKRLGSGTLRLTILRDRFAIVSGLKIFNGEFVFSVAVICFVRCLILAVRNQDMGGRSRLVVQFPFIRIL